MESANGKVERAPRASRASVGDGSFDRLSVTLNPHLLTAHSVVHLSRVDGNNGGLVVVVLSARAWVAVLLYRGDGGSKRRKSVHGL